MRIILQKNSPNLVFLVTDAQTPFRIQLLINTILAARKRAGESFDLLVWVNSPQAKAAMEAELPDVQLCGTGTNMGMHVAFEYGVQFAIEHGYKYLIRMDGDVEFMTQRWLKKLTEASRILDDKCVVSPRIRGMHQWEPKLSDLIVVKGLAVYFERERVPGLCRLVPVELLKKGDYHTDIRLPLGRGDMDHFNEWCMFHDISKVFVRKIRVKHAKGTRQQMQADPVYAKLFNLRSCIPYIPRYTKDEV